MYQWGYGCDMFHMGWYSWIAMVVFWVLVILGIFLLIRWIARGAQTRGILDDPLEIARQRYAKGEIKKEKYEEIRRTLRKEEG